MAKNISNRKPNVKNLRSHSLIKTKKKQGINLQVVRLENGQRVRISARELRAIKKDQKVEA